MVTVTCVIQHTLLVTPMCVQSLAVLGGWLKLMALDISVLRLSVTTCLCLRRNVCNHITKGSIINGMWSLMAS